MRLWGCTMKLGVRHLTYNVLNSERGDWMSQFQSIQTYSYTALRNEFAKPLVAVLFSAFCMVYSV